MNQHIAPGSASHRKDKDETEDQGDIDDSIQSIDLNADSRHSNQHQDQSDDLDLIVVQESTKYFSASSARVRYSDGLEHDFLPPQTADPRQNITFGEGGIGTYLAFSFNFTSGKDEFKRKWWGKHWKHSAHIWLQLPPKGYEGEYDYQWKISTAWHTPRMQWEWLEIGWKDTGFAILPLGNTNEDENWNALHCDSMDFFLRDDKETFHQITLKDATLASYLPEGAGFRPDDLRVYSPCGGKSCHIINNQIHCRRLGVSVSAGVFLLFAAYTLFVAMWKLCKIFCELWNMVCLEMKRRRVNMVDQEIIELARKRERAWDLAQKVEENEDINLKGG